MFNPLDPFGLFTPPVLLQWPVNPNAVEPSPIVMGAALYAQWFATMQLLTRPADGTD